jgi:hypothetical protein
MKDVTPRRRRQRSPLLMGLGLILVGTLMLMFNLGFGLPPGLWRYWPLGLIALGLVGIIAPTRHLRRSGGIWILAAGVYWQIGLLHLFGLGFGSAWPIFIIAAGLSVIVDPKDVYHPPHLDTHRHDPGETRQGAS